MIRILMFMFLLSIPSVGLAQDDVVKCSWWGPFTAVGEDVSQLEAFKKATKKRQADYFTIVNHLPEDMWIADARSDHQWTRGKGGTHILTITWSVKVCEWLPLPKPLPRRLP